MDMVERSVPVWNHRWIFKITWGFIINITTLNYLIFVNGKHRFLLIP